MILSGPSMRRPEHARPPQTLGSDPGESSPRATEAHETVNTPSVASRAKRLPIVDRVSPQLALRAEVIRRHAGDDTSAGGARPEEKNSGLAHTSLESGETKNGKSPISPTPFACAYSFQLLALPEQQKLRKADHVHLSSERPPCFR